jgi:hypothetical protein
MESSFRTAHDVALELDSRTPADRRATAPSSALSLAGSSSRPRPASKRATLAELVDAAVARLVGEVLELEPGNDRAELGHGRPAPVHRSRRDRIHACNLSGKFA